MTQNNTHLRRNDQRQTMESCVTSLTSQNKKGQWGLVFSRQWSTWDLCFCLQHCCACCAWQRFTHRTTPIHWGCVAGRSSGPWCSPAEDPGGGEQWGKRTLCQAVSTQHFEIMFEMNFKIIQILNWMTVSTSGKQGLISLGRWQRNKAGGPSLARPKPGSHINVLRKRLP